MATFEAVVSKYKRRDNTYNVQILVYHNGKKLYPATKIFLAKDDITRSFKIKNQKIIDSLNDITRDCREKCNKHARALGGMDVHQVVDLVKDIIEGKKENDSFRLDFFAFGRNYAKTIKSKGTAGLYVTSLNNLEKFVGKPELDINTITSKFIMKWITWIQEQPALFGKTKGNRAQSLYPSCIRKIHNAAKEEYNDEDLGIINIPLSPFDRVKLPSQPVTRKRALSILQIKEIMNLPYNKETKDKTCRFNLAKDMFLLSFFLVGINSADLYFVDHFEDGRITYKRRKTTSRRADKAEISIKLEPEIQELFNKYKDPDNVRIFKFHKMYADMSTFNSAINKGLKQVAKCLKEKYDELPDDEKEKNKHLLIDDLEYYAARHSWATIAQNDAGVNKYDVHEALNHAPEGEMKVTEIYTKKDWTKIDKANRKVIDLFY